MKVYWQQENNFGDKLTPYILEKLFNVDCEFSREGGKLLGVGSILHHATSGDVIWGSGLISARHLPQDLDIRVLAVRGPVTAMVLERIGVPNMKNVVYGDPALLLPRIYNPEIKKVYDYGYIPHYTDYDLVKAHYSYMERAGKAKVIDVRDDIETIIDQILSCRSIYSSSLHGLIVADAYRIPNKRVIYKGELVGKDFKFDDYERSKRLVNLDKLVEVFKLKLLNENVASEN